MNSSDQNAYDFPPEIPLVLRVPPTKVFIASPPTAGTVCEHGNPIPSMAACIECVSG